LNEDIQGRTRMNDNRVECKCAPPVATTMQLITQRKERFPALPMRCPRRVRDLSLRQPGRCRIADDFDQAVNKAIRLKQVSRLENGPKAGVPVASIAYQPPSMPRRSDWRSFMYCAVCGFTVSPLGRSTAANVGICNVVMTTCDCKTHEARYRAESFSAAVLRQWGADGP
jgi:hypothetical protein